MHWLKKIYSDYGITQAQLSRGTGIKEGTLSTIINRGTPIENVKGGNLRTIARYLNTTVEKLLDRYSG